MSIETLDAAVVPLLEQITGDGYVHSYWMPFNGGIGMHDASWRGSFGGSIYKTNGSHGCINLPVKAAKTIYENISAGMPVLCYHLEGTESKKSTSAPKETAPATTAPATTAPVPEATTPPTAAPGETMNPTPEGTTPGNPVGPGGETPGNPAGPGGETPGGPNSWESQPSPSAPGETAPSQPAEPQPAPPTESSATVQPESPDSPLDETPTAGGDEDHFGPGFTNGGQTPQPTEPPVGPGY